MSSKPQGDMRSAYGSALLELGESNPNVVVLGADTTDSLKTLILEKNTLNVSSMWE